MDTDHYPDHVKRVDGLIASGEAGRKVAKEIAEDQKVFHPVSCTVHCVQYVLWYPYIRFDNYAVHFV